MIKNTFGESLIGIIIGIFILSFIMLGVTNLLINSKTVIDNYENKKTISLLKNNSENIIKEIDISSVNESENFYIYKNTTTKEFEILKGTINEKYKYIDKYGNYIDNLENFDGNVYSRVLLLERNDSLIGENHQIIKIDINKIIIKK